MPHLRRSSNKAQEFNFPNKPFDLNCVLQFELDYKYLPLAQRNAPTGYLKDTTHEHFLSLHRKFQVISSRRDPEFHNKTSQQPIGPLPRASKLFQKEETQSIATHGNPHKTVAHSKLETELI